MRISKLLKTRLEHFLNGRRSREKIKDLQESLFDIGETRNTSGLQELMDTFWDQPQELLEGIFVKLNFQQFTDDMESVYVELLGRAGFQLVQANVKCDIPRHTNPCKGGALGVRVGWWLKNLSRPIIY